MTKEPLEGVLSEALLDELASDLGIDPTILRAHPVFRVLKGAVLLTYPLKVPSESVYEQEATTFFSQVEPVTSQWYPVLDEDDVRLKYIFVTHNYAEARLLDLRLTIDGVVIETPAPVDVTNDQIWFAYRTLTLSYMELALSATVYLADMYTGLPGSEVLLEMRTVEAIDGGKYMGCRVAFERLKT